MVVTMFGAMFAPRPDVVARELCRVCRRGGEIAMASSTPTGFIGELFRVTGKHVTPPSGVTSPLLWGDEATVREQLQEDVADIRAAKILIPHAISLSLFRRRSSFTGFITVPRSAPFAGLTVTAQAELRRDLEELYQRHNQAVDGTTSIAAEYLEVVAVRA